MVTAKELVHPKNYYCVYYSIQPKCIKTLL